MTCFNRHIRRFLVEKAGFALDELRSWTFIQLCEALEPYVHSNDDLLNGRWRDALGDVYKLGLQHLDYWRSRTKEAIFSMVSYEGNAALFRDDEGAYDKDVNVKVPFPYMDGMQDWARNFRRPTPNDLPWMYLVTGLKIEGIFSLDDTFVPSDIKGRIRCLPAAHFDGSVWGLLEGEASPQDFAVWAEFIKQDLAGLKPPEGQAKVLEIPPTNLNKVAKVVGKNHKARKMKTPPQLLKETRERYIAEELLKIPQPTSIELAAKLDCNKSTICRSGAWKNRRVFSTQLPEGIIVHGKDDSYSVDAVEETEPED